VALARELFLKVRKGDVVSIKDPLKPLNSNHRYFIARVIYIVSSPRNPSFNSIFQVIEINTGFISYVNANLVCEIINSSNRR
tara:strand:+ start:1453 stop:1698 length:246 start_codon:yes stop_codon:yes gene_type:complete